MTSEAMDEVIRTSDIIDVTDLALPKGFSRVAAVKVAKRLLLESAYNKDEWVEYHGRQITYYEWIVRKLMQSSSWQANMAILKFVFGEAPQVNKVEGEVEVTFKVEHDDSWMEAHSISEDDEVDALEATYEVVS